MFRGLSYLLKNFLLKKGSSFELGKVCNFHSISTDSEKDLVVCN